MSKPDTYKTIKSESSGLFKDRGSKFIGLAYRVRSVEEFQSSLEKAKKEYRDARHHCFAYKIGLDDDTWRVNDDGEPSGTAGKPIMGQINSFELTNVLIVVVRYFGGTLLGVGGLINAYRNAAREALEKAVIISEIITQSYDLEFPYLAMNNVMTLIKEENLSQSKQVFELSCSMRISFRKSIEESILVRLSKIKDLRYKAIES
jgi:uncharacterized YigZ family protein